MNGLFKQFFKDKIIRLSQIITFLMFVVLCGATIFYYMKLPPFIPLYNQLPWGMERLSDRIGIFLPLSLAFAFFVLNTIVAALIHGKMPLIARILSITSFLIVLLTFIFTARTIQLIL